MKKRILFIGLALLLVVGLVAIGCEEEEETTTPITTTPPVVTKDSILVGAARPLSGAWAVIGDSALKPIMEMWQEDVNAAGGIYVAEYGKSLPIEYLVYDDTSDLGTMVRLTEKLIVEDQVDVLFPACGTSMISAQAPIANKYEMVLLTAEGGATFMKDALPGMPYIFICLNFSDWYQLPILFDMLAAEGAETAYFISMADLFGIEYGGVATNECNRVGIDVIDNVTVPLFPEDFEPYIKEAKDADPDVFAVWGYPWIVAPACAESIAQGFNPDAWIGGPGANFEYFRTLYFGPAVEGVISFGVANHKTSPEFAELFDRLIDMVGLDNADWWGWPLYSPLVQIWEESIEATGTLDQSTIRDYIATTTFDTILGPTWFTIFGEGGGCMAYECHPGEVGQWQNEYFEIVGGNITTADFLYPKPAWPTE